MSSFQIKFRINEVKRNLANATDSQEIAKLENDLKEWKFILHDVQMQEFEDRVGFKSMEQNAGVWDER
jgi:ribosomal protein L25 (general stress protein Ctc)